MSDLKRFSQRNKKKGRKERPSRTAPVVDDKNNWIGKWPIESILRFGRKTQTNDVRARGLIFKAPGSGTPTSATLLDFRRGNGSNQYGTPPKEIWDGVSESADNRQHLWRIPWRLCGFLRRLRGECGVVFVNFGECTVNAVRKKRLFRFNAVLRKFFIIVTQWWDLEKVSIW